MKLNDMIEEIDHIDELKRQLEMITDRMERSYADRINEAKLRIRENEVYKRTPNTTIQKWFLTSNTQLFKDLIGEYGVPVEVLRRITVVYRNIDTIYRIGQYPKLNFDISDDGATPVETSNPSGYMISGMTEYMTEAGIISDDIPTSRKQYIKTEIFLGSYSVSYDLFIYPEWVDDMIIILNALGKRHDKLTAQVATEKIDEVEKVIAQSGIPRDEFIRRLRDS
ncbi:hypothetical protein EniLVp02_0222 [Vibrio phage EniLVp02]